MVMLLRRVVLSVVVAAGAFSAVSARTEEQFAVGHISSSLLQHAGAVMRNYELEVEVASLDEVNTREHYVVTILNDRGREYASVRQYFEKLLKIRRMTASAFDKDGKEILSLKESDFLNSSLAPGSGYYDDRKVRHYDFGTRTYPYTIEVTVECTQKYSFSLPDWMPQPGDDCAVEHASFTVTAPAALGLRYRELHTPKATVTAAGDNSVYTWHADNIPAATEEPMRYESYLDRPCVLLNPTKFHYGEYEGSMQGWKELGSFLYELNKERDVLPGDEQEKIRLLTRTAATEKEKISILYKYLQDNFRYVAIEYGISGFQTLDAGFLAANRYGDCKALSNYMMSILKVAGITSYPVVIHAGRENTHKVLTDFPSEQFNHVILCVPSARDTTWLECTSNDLAAGYLGDFTQDRYGLMITPGGGVLVHTPAYGAAVNKTVRTAKAAMTTDGILQITMDNIYCGEPAQKVLYSTEHVSDHELSRYVNEKFSLPGYEVEKKEYRRKNAGAVTGVQEQLVLQATNMVSAAGGNTVIDADLAPIHFSVPVLTEDRKTPFFITSSFSVEDSFSVAIPVGSGVEFMPEPVSVQYPFGNYQCAFSKTGDAIQVHRLFSQQNGVYPAADYSKLEAFADLLNDEGKMKVVLKQK